MEDENAPYPWGGPYIRNAKGCYLANFSPRSDVYRHSRIAQDESGQQEYYYDYPNDDYSITRADDGEGFIAPVKKKYWPNDYGLYQIAGNAAEMMAEKGVSAGGSWLDPAFYIQTGTRNSYQQPKVDLGFRVYMRVAQ